MGEGSIKTRPYKYFSLLTLKVITTLQSSMLLSNIFNLFIILREKAFSFL